MIYIYKIYITGQPDHDPNTRHCLNGAGGKIYYYMYTCSCPECSIDAKQQLIFTLHRGLN